MESITATDVVASILQGMADWEVIPIERGNGERKYGQTAIVKVFVDEEEVVRVFVEGDEVSLFIRGAVGEEAVLSLSDPNFDIKLAEALIVTFTNYMGKDGGKAFDSPIWPVYIEKLKEYISRG